MTHPTHLGLHHLALFCEHFEAMQVFYRDVLGMQVEWQPDADNTYLTSGNDNLALHRLVGDPTTWPTTPGRLDHLGFILPSEESVDEWYAHCQAHQVRVLTSPKKHRDGPKSFYCLDPDGNRVQLIYHPPIVPAL